MFTTAHRVDQLNPSTVRISGTVSSSELLRCYQEHRQSAAASIIHDKLLTPSSPPFPWSDTIQRYLEEELENLVVTLIQQHQLFVVGRGQWKFSSDSGSTLSDILELLESHPELLIRFELFLEVYPRPRIQGYECIEIEIPVSPDIDGLVEQRTLELRRSRARLKDIGNSRPAGYGDVLSLNISISSDNDGLLNESLEIDIELGKAVLPTQVEDRLVGTQVGETITVGIVADDADDCEFLVYTITIKRVAERYIPDMNESLIMELGLPPCSKEALRKLMIEEEEKQVHRHQIARIEQELWRHLLRANDFTLPKVWIQEAVKSISSDDSELLRSAVEIVGIGDSNKTLAVVAEKWVRHKVIVEGIARQENLGGARSLNDGCSDFMKNIEGPVISKDCYLRVKDFLMERAKISFQKKESSVSLQAAETLGERF